MPTSFTNSSLFRLLFPVVLVTILAIGRDSVTLIAALNHDIVENLPYMLFGIAIILSHSFNQGRIGFVALSMLYAYIVIQTQLQQPLTDGTTAVKLSLLTLLLPVACFAVHLFLDGRVFSRSGTKFGLLLTFLTIWSVVSVDYATTMDLKTLIAEGLLFTIPQISRIPFVLVAYSVALVGITAIAVLRRNNSSDVVIYSSLLLSSMTFIFFHLPYISSILFSLAGILLIIYVMSASHELAFLDQLTGIPGRYALNSDLKQLGRKYSIAMLDVDHFKKFNDTYGHDIGDDVLKLVASKMKSLQGKAKIYRYGGEEFTLLFKRRSSSYASEFANILREEIASYEMKIRNSDSRPDDEKIGQKQRGKNAKNDTVSITISIGIADNSFTKDPLEVIKLADKALYKAKGKGRNCVVTFNG